MVTFTFAAPRRSAAAGHVATAFPLDAMDGDLYLTLR